MGYIRLMTNTPNRQGPRNMSSGAPMNGIPRNRAVAGMTLVEIMIAVAVVALALLGIMSAVSAATTLQETSREKAVAYMAARELLESMRSDNFADLYSRYNNTSQDDPIETRLYTIGLRR